MTLIGALGISVRGWLVLLFRGGGGGGIVRLRDQEMELRDFSNLQGEVATLRVIKTDLTSRLATVAGNLEVGYLLHTYMLYYLAAVVVASETA